MTTLTRFETEAGIELLIDTATGESYCSINGYARMSGRDKSTISRRLEAVAKGEHKTAEIQTEGGLQAVALINEDLISDWIIQDNPAIAKQLLKAGVRVFMHKLAGYEVTSTALESKPQTTADMLLMFAQAFKEHEQRLSDIELENLELKRQLAEQKHLVEAVQMETEANTCELERFSNGHGYWYSIAGWCAKHGVKQSIQWMAAQGKKASALCRRKGLKPVPLSDPRFGNVNTYPDSVLSELVW